MKKIVIEEPIDSIPLSRVSNRDIVAYKSKNSAGVCMLVKLTQHGPKSPMSLKFTEQWWGFVQIGGSTASSPRFVSTTAHGAIKNAVDAGREILVFGTVAEFLEFVPKDLCTYGSSEEC